MPKITLGQVLSKVKERLAEIRNVPPKSIHVEYKLRDDLHFSEPGVRQLAQRFNAVFEKWLGAQLTPGAVADCETVLDVVKLIWESIPAGNQA